MVLVLANATHFCTLGLALISSTGYIVAREPVHRVVAGPADHGKDLGALEPGLGIPLAHVPGVLQPRDHVVDGQLGAVAEAHLFFLTWQAPLPPFQLASTQTAAAP